jgi:adenylosuccinate synthase
VPVRERLRISPSCPLILSFHVALDQAREKARGELKIGTTGRGIGPAYEDKVARRGLRVGDLFHRERFAAKLGELLDYHNFVLVNYYKEPAIDFQKTLDECMEYAELLKPMMLDVTAELHDLRRAGKDIMFEGAQGSLLDIDHGTYPYVTSSNTTAGGIATGSGVGPMFLDYILGITKAYTTRVGSGPFPTELFDEVGAHLAKRGHEFGHHRPCPSLRLVRCRYPASRHRCEQHLGHLPDQAGRTGRPGNHQHLHRLQESDGQCDAPTDADSYIGLQPVYEEMPGWSESTVGAKTLEELPHARAYIKRVEELVGAPIDIISTGPDRNETIVLRHPFA